MNRGLIIPKIEQDHWILGGLSGVKGEVINEKGDWLPYKPTGEPQSKNWETSACSCFGTLNSVETLLSFLGKQNNFSDRFMAIISGTEPDYGNDPHKVAETFRKQGGIDEALLPFSKANTLQEFYSPKPMTSDLLKEGLSFLTSWSFAHEWVTPTKENLKLALTKGTVSVSVYAWEFDAVKQEYVKPIGAQDNHWVSLLKFDGDNPIIFDSYDAYVKKLSKDFTFSIAKVYYLTPVVVKKNESIYEKIINFIKSLLHL